MVDKLCFYETIKEFLRYVIVGGAAFIADLVVLVAVRELLLKSYVRGVYVAAVIGFIAGLTVNYLLSIFFAFKVARSGKGRSLGAFVIFTCICLLGLLFTEIGMWLGIEVLGGHYVAVKIFVAGAVLIWNYAAKKILLFRA